MDNYMVKMLKVRNTYNEHSFYASFRKSITHLLQGYLFVFKLYIIK